MNYLDLDVIVLTYNRSNFLKTALRAICESTATWNKTIVLKKRPVSQGTFRNPFSYKENLPKRMSCHIN